MCNRLNTAVKIVTLTILALFVHLNKALTAPQPETNMATNSHDIKLVVKPSQGKFNTSDIVLISLVVANASDKPISYEERGFILKEFTLTVTDSSNQSLPLTRFGRMVQNQQLPTAVFRNVIRSIPPGHEGIYHFWLNRQYDMTLPGTYYVTISRHFTTDSGKTMILTSARTPVVVTAPINVFDKNDNNLEVPTFQKIIAPAASGISKL